MVKVTHLVNFLVKGINTMPTKPKQAELKAAEYARKNPDFAKDALRAIINETPELRDALLARGLVKEK